MNDHDYEVVVDWIIDQLTDYPTAMRVMTRWVGLVEKDLPEVGRAALAVARSCWLAGRPVDLLSSRVACWRYLAAKNGNSTTIADREDYAMRALICCLYPKSEEQVSFLEDSLSFALEMFDHLSVDPESLKAIADAP